MDWKRGLDTHFLAATNSNPDTHIRGLFFLAFRKLFKNKPNSGEFAYRGLNTDIFENTKTANKGHNNGLLFDNKFNELKGKKPSFWSGGGYIFC